MGSEHTLKISTVTNLGNLYKDQVKMIEAEKIYIYRHCKDTKAFRTDHGGRDPLPIYKNYTSINNDLAD